MVEPQSKKCRRCDKVKPIEKFGASRAKDGSTLRRHLCNVCKNRNRNSTQTLREARFEDTIILRPPLKFAPRAACRGANPDLWHPSTPSDRDTEREECYAEAKQVCIKCPVRLECLQHAITCGEHRGMWGGTMPRERKLGLANGMSAKDLIVMVTQ